MPYFRRIPLIWPVLPILLITACTDRLENRKDDPASRPGEGAAINPLPSDAPVPSPNLSAEEVVRIQLEALRSNGPTDAGIEVVYRFASPENKRSTGPLERFKLLVKSPAYHGMLGYSNIEYLPAKVYGEVAQQLVVVESESQEPEAFLFILSRQDHGPDRGCWMTDAVIRGQLQEPEPPIRSRASKRRIRPATN